MSTRNFNSIFTKLAEHIGTAIEKSHAGFLERRVEQEPAFTDRMLGRIEQSVEGREIDGVRWSAKTLTHRGSGSQESTDGADFMGVLNVDMPDYQVCKGFLAQAKMIRTSGFTDYSPLVDQCRKMLKLSPAAFVFLYTAKGVEVVSATSVLASGGNIRHLEKRSAANFFKAHLQCFLGDPNIKAATPEQLEELRRRQRARNAIMLSATAW